MSNEYSPGQAARVILDYRCAYPDPLAICTGEVLAVGECDTEWPGYVWCTNRAGKGGWVPASYLDRQGELGVARCDYTARELTVSAGEILTVEKAESGWLWAVNPAGESGWVPAKHVEKL